MITLTKYTAHRPTRLSKKFSLVDGQLVKEPGGKLIEASPSGLLLPTSARSRRC